jgi:hypothetical protein
MSGRGHECSLGQISVVLIVPELECEFAIEKKTQRKSNVQSEIQY